MIIIRLWGIWGLGIRGSRFYVESNAENAVSADRGKRSVRSFLVLMMLAIFGLSFIVLAFGGFGKELYLKHLYARGVSSQSGATFIQRLAAPNDDRSRLLMVGIATHRDSTLYARDESMNVLVSSDDGQDLMCEQMDAGNGTGGHLENADEQLWISKLLARTDHVSKGCVAKMLKRLETRTSFEDPKLTGQLTSSQSLANSAEISILEANGNATVDALRERNHLGSGDVDPEAFQAIRILSLYEACPLLSSGLAHARIESSLWLSEYQEMFDRYCGSR